MFGFLPSIDLGACAPFTSRPFASKRAAFALKPDRTAAPGGGRPARKLGRGQSLRPRPLGDDFKLFGRMAFPFAGSFAPIRQAKRGPKRAAE
jgi:hypothetical protein